ncbi:TAXI family TRAP transporter solute-binding subunit [Arthrobacter globiformis]|uniref:C4-dicarboxylate ABC transporter substrate-binding protein n=1 Tax=Arthrobacter globiformis TaxID=1665 RepID=A0A328HJS7_ARTGO|nr:TAXI family TRAP transporter solute-binding subunit [Arthrobacter globiformis]RAM38819.1 C4-dicarboxylate ABC transporter substrate-binding protein [Arthrobacter globiformis]
MRPGRQHPVGRRGVLKSGLGLALGAVSFPGIAACTASPGPARVTVAGGEAGGFYLEFATLLAESLQRHGIAQRAEPLTTGGSLDNMKRLVAGEATFAVALLDAAVQQTVGQPAGAMVAVGKVYENYVHCLVRRDSGIGNYRDLTGRRIGIGEAGSGTSLTAKRILEVSGLAGSARAVTEVNLGLNDGLGALRRKAVDALFWSGGVPTAAITKANDEPGLRLLDLSSLVRPLRDRFGAFYDRVLIPGSGYPGAGSVWTVGVANLLLCRGDLDGGIVRNTVRLLVDHADELVPRSSLGVQFLSPDTLINTADLPLHPAAAEAYRTLHG